MAYEVEVTDEWLEWFNQLTAEEQDEIAAAIGLLENRGPHLPFPYSSGVSSSRHSHMRELRTQVHGRPFRTLYAFAGGELGAGVTSHKCQLCGHAPY